MKISFGKNNCKDLVWTSSPTKEWTQAQKAQHNRFVENELEKLSFSELGNKPIDFDDKKRKITEVY